MRIKNCVMDLYNQQFWNIYTRVAIRPDLIIHINMINSGKFPVVRKGRFLDSVGLGCTTRKEV